MQNTRSLRAGKKHNDVKTLKKKNTNNMGGQNGNLSNDERMRYSAIESRLLWRISNRNFRYFVLQFGPTRQSRLKRMKRKSPLFEKFARIFLAYEGRKHFSMLFRVLFNILTRVSFHVFHLPNHRIRVCETARITQMAPAPLVFIQQI